jgi:hypothetical protein
MEMITVVMAPEPLRTRMLALGAQKDVLKAVLPPLSGAHPRAAATVLEGLSLWTQQRLSVVLVVDEEARSSCATSVLCDALGYGESSLHFEVGVAAHPGRRRRRRLIEGVGDFRDLRPLRLEVQR